MRLQSQQVSIPPLAQILHAHHFPKGRQEMATTDKTSAPATPPATSPPCSPTASTTAKSTTTPSPTAKRTPPASKAGATTARWFGATPPPSAATRTTAPLPANRLHRTAVQAGTRIWRIRTVAVLALLPSSPCVTIILKVRLCPEMHIFDAGNE